MSNQPPVLPFSNDGSFMERFHRMQQAQQLLAEAAGKAGGPSSQGDAAPPPPPPPAESGEPAGAAGSRQPQGGSTPAPPAEQPAASQEPGSNGSAGAPAAAGDAAASGGLAEPGGPSSGAQQPRPRSAPSMVLKSRKSIVQVRTRSGEALQPGSGKRAKKEEAGDGKPASEEQSFYLKEMQRFRQSACEGSTGDRPLVK